MLTDVEAAAYAVAASALLWLHVRRPQARAFVVALGLLALPVSFFGTSAALSNLRYDQPVLTVAQPAVMGCAAVVAVIAAAAVLLGRPGGRAPALVGAVTVIAVVGAVVVTYGRSVTVDRALSDATLVAEDVAFMPTTVRARPGRFSMMVENRDLFWHTVTIPELGVDLRVPVGAVRYVGIRVQPGTYTFYCAVPGHRQVGMEGTLTVG